MKKIKMIINILMFIITILLMDINKVGRNTHEVLGISLALLLFIHIVLNFKWIKQITKNLKKVKKQTKILYIVDILIFIIYFITILLGLSTSSILDLKIASLLKSMFLHYIFGRIACVFMLIHIGFHLRTMLGKIMKDETVKIVIYIIYTTITILVTLILFYALTKTYIWTSIM